MPAKKKKKTATAKKTAARPRPGTCAAGRPLVDGDRCRAAVNGNCECSA